MSACSKIPIHLNPRPSSRCAFNSPSNPRQEEATHWHLLVPKAPSLASDAEVPQSARTVGSEVSESSCADAAVRRSLPRDRTFRESVREFGDLPSRPGEKVDRSSRRLGELVIVVVGP